MGKTLEKMQPFTRALNKSHLIAAGFSYDDLQKADHRHCQFLE